MRSYKKIITLGLSLFLISASACFAGNNYSPRALQIYNVGAMFQNQGKYEMAIRQYEMALQLQPNFPEVKHNLSVLYGNLAIRSSNAKDYFQAITYARKSLELNPKDVDMYSLIGDSFSNLKKNDHAIQAYKKVVALDPTNVSAMHSIAQLYIKEKNYAQASPYYHKILKIDPNDQIAQQNSRYVDSQLKENNLQESLDDLRITERAPIAIDSLIRPAKGVSSDSVEKSKLMIDLIWSDPTGKILINNLIKCKVPINITNQGALDANATQTKKQTFLYMTDVPLLSLGKSLEVVNLPAVYADNFYNQSVSSTLRIYSLHAFVHEFCHAYRTMNFPQAQNSLEEELGASMIGMNISYKVITGKYLSQKQTEEYSKQYLKSLLSDDHRDLPVYSNFQANMQGKGIEMPYPEVYANLIPIYKALLKSGEVSHDVNLDAFIK